MGSRQSCVPLEKWLIIRHSERFGKSWPSFAYGAAVFPLFFSPHGRSFFISFRCRGEKACIPRGIPVSYLRLNEDWSNDRSSECHPLKNFLFALKKISKSSEIFGAFFGFHAKRDCQKPDGERKAIAFNWKFLSFYGCRAGIIFAIPLSMFFRKRDSTIAMRSNSANILIGFLCVALLAATVPLRDLDGRPEMLGTNTLGLNDAIRFVQQVIPEAGDNFLPDAKNAVLALEAVAEIPPSFMGGDDQKKNNPNPSSLLFLPSFPLKIVKTDFFSSIETHSEVFISKFFNLPARPPEG